MTFSTRTIRAFFIVSFIKIILETILIEYIISLDIINNFFSNSEETVLILILNIKN